MKGRIIGLIPFLSVAFINAAVDLGHKILIQNTLFKLYDDATQVALTAIVNALILLPFILLFTPAGFLSDRFSKPRIMQWSAFSAIIITLLITLSYYQGWFICAFALTFMLAAQSALYSPAKYGYIREITDKQHLPMANGYLQATTIVAILTGIFVFTILFELLLAGKNYQTESELIKLIAPLGWGLVGLSVIEFVLSLRLPKLIAGNPQQPFDWSNYRKGQLLRQNLQMLTHNRLIWFCILGLSLFWGTSQTMLAVFPAFAKIVLLEENTIIIQGLLACSGIGIIVGSLLAGKLCKQQIHFLLIFFSAMGLIAMLLIIPMLSSVMAFTIAIIGFGLFGGLFIIPLNSLIQLNAEPHQLGMTLAGNNWIQNLTMTSFLLLTFLAASFQTSSQLFLTALPWLSLVLVVPVLYKLKQKI